MLKVVTGSYHPELEAALVKEICSLKFADSCAPIALIVPSDPLKRRLKQLLCVEHMLTLLDVRVLTFHQLAVQLAGERQAVKGEASPEVVPDLFFGALLRHVAQRRLPGTEALDVSVLAPGGWHTFWATIRDLKDALVEPSDALRGIRDGVFATEDADWLRALFTLYAAVREAGRVLEVGSADDLAASVQAWVPESPFVKRLARVCYYGFYDLTQVQLSFFEAIARAAETTLYFPSGDGPAFAFAKKFFERSLAPLAASPDQVVRASRGSRDRCHNPTVRVMHAAGPEDELTLVCVEILTLLETNGYRLDEIGVVARTLEPYRASLRRTFDGHRIPFVTTALRPLLEEPAAKAVLQLARLPLTDYYRVPMLEVLTSPYAARPEPRGEGPDFRPDLWSLIAQTLGITRGRDEWQRLMAAGELEVWTGGSEATTDGALDAGGGIRIDAVHVRHLAGAVARLLEDCCALPAQGSIGELTEAFIRLIPRHLAVPGLQGSDNDEARDVSQLVGLTLTDALRALRQLDRLGEVVTWQEWTELLTQAMEGAAIPLEPFAHAGVQVLDAMAARGLPFRALFVLGMNEQIFPRAIREDAFLRDRHRRVLSETLGYKIDEKLGGHDEERLLAALLEASAHDRLTLCYQRADVDGRPLAPSSYLDELRGEVDRESEVVMPRRLSERLDLPLGAAPLLTRDELAVGWIVHGRDPMPVLDALDRAPAVFRHGMVALHELESAVPGLGLYDGLTGRVARHWDALMTRGLAPTPLEHYARCPFQYFAGQVLRLEPVRSRPSYELPAQAWGLLCHDVVHRCYKRLCEAGWPSIAMADSTKQTHIERATAESFADYSVTHGCGYPLLWAMAQEAIRSLVAAVVQSDEASWRETGFRPVAFEVEASGNLASLGESVLASLRVRGRLDRMDRGEAPPRLRIVDYKYRHGGRMKDDDRNLAQSAVRGYRLQPPLYARLQPEGQPDPPHAVEFIFLGPRWQMPVERTSFEWPAPDSADGHAILRTLQRLTDGIREGRYFVLPNGYCDYCAFTVACRRYHGPTWWRTHMSAAAKELRQVRRETLEQRTDNE